MPSGPPLDGITVLDLSTVGPASRCSRILADYGATVIKVGPAPAEAGVQIHRRSIGVRRRPRLKHACAST